MKKIFKVCLVAIVLLVGIDANAQNNPVTFGVKVGVNLSNYSGDVEGTDAKLGFLAGATVDYALSESFFLQSGLELTTKGAKKSATENGNEITYTETPIYLQLPIHAAYKINVAEGTKIVFNAGPYLAYGIGGKLKTENKTENVSEDKNVFTKDGSKRFDFGLGGGVGAEFGKIAVHLGYDLGLANINQMKEIKVRNQNAYLTVGYKF